MITSNMSRPRAERQTNERVSAGAGAVMGAGRGEGSASDEPQSNERVSSERDN
jgi:hypothetical protein